MGEAVVALSCGWRHTAALSAHAHLYTWGHGGAGQLGHGGTIHFFLPLRLQSHAASFAPDSASSDAASDAGANADADAEANAAAPPPPPTPTWVQVSCGARHTAALGEGALSWDRMPGGAKSR